MGSMTVLVADDEPVSRAVVTAMLRKAGYEVRISCDGNGAWAELSGDDPPPLALLDWMMPGLDGPEIIERVRAQADRAPTYVILLTSRDQPADIVTGLRAGADDYVTKPPDEDELVARVNVGRRVVELQTALADRVRSLEDALANVKTLQGLLPMCAYCKAIRNDQNYWERVETYFHEHSDLQFSHSFCPACYERFVKPQLEALGEVEDRPSASPRREP